MKPIRQILVLCVLMLGIVSGCSQSDSAGPKLPNFPTTPGPAVTASTTAGQRFVDIVLPLNTALQNFGTQASHLPPTATPQDLAKLVGPVVTAIQTSTHGLETQSWPPPAQLSINNLKTSLGAIASDLSQAGNQTPDKIGAWATHLQADEANTAQASLAVRKALDLPTDTINSTPSG